MSRRALDFATAHPLDNEGFAVALKQLEAAVDRATQLGLQETTGKTGQHSGVAQRRVARRKLRKEFLVRVVRLGQLAAQDHAGLIGLFNLPRIEAPTKDFLLEARAILAAATTHADILIPMGLGSTFVAELGVAIDQFQSIGATIDAGRGDHVGAAKGFGKALGACRSIVAVVDTYYQAAFPAGGELMAAWESARSVEGPFRHKADAAADTPAPDATPGPDTKVA